MTAARELQEETGIHASPGELVPVAYTTGQADLGWANGLFRDDFFLHRAVAPQVDIAGLNDFERTHYARPSRSGGAGPRAASETIYVANLAAAPLGQPG